VKKGRRLPLYLAAVAVAAAGGIATVYANAGTSGYSVPEAACGLPVSSSALDALLPDGGEFEQRDRAQTSSPVKTHLECRMLVDDEAVLTSSVSEFTTTESVVEWYGQTPDAYGITNGRESSIGGEAAILGEDGALVHVTCPGIGPDAVFEVSVRYYAAAVRGEEAREALRDYTESFTNSATAEFGCS
jgi:hypothetical protein